MAEMDLSMGNSRNGAKYSDCSTAVFDAHSFCGYCREKLLETEAHEDLLEIPRSLIQFLPHFNWTWKCGEDRLWPSY